jgi:hypothetical protein
MQGTEDPREVVARERAELGLEAPNSPEPPKELPMSGVELQRFLSRQEIIDRLIAEMNEKQAIIASLVAAHGQAIELALLRKGVSSEFRYRANLDTGTFVLVTGEE